ncbi:MAG: hypothetical protein ACM37W_12535 [Actinomycetota bacterium]
MAQAVGDIVPLFLLVVVLVTGSALAEILMLILGAWQWPQFPLWLSLVGISLVLAWCLEE